MAKPRKYHVNIVAFRIAARLLADPRTKEKQKRHCYNIKFKLEVISYVKTHGNKVAQRNYGLTEKG